MNAMFGFKLEAQPSSLLSRLDCSSEENVKDALHQLRRCATDADYGRWARTWGENLCVAADEVAGRDMVDAETLNEAEAGAERAERERDTLKMAIDAHVRDMDRVMEGAPDELIDRVNDLIAKLENAA